ncbi:MAG: YcxB family protein [Eubacteriales bacterium]
MDLSKTIIEVSLDEKSFVSFAWFHAFIHTKRWRLMLFFGLFMLFFILIALFIAPEDSQKVLAIAVLSVVAILLPSGHVLHFHLSLKQQCRLQRLGSGRYVYTLTLPSQGDISIKNETEQTTQPWEGVHAFYFRDHCAYLYVSPVRAYLIPYAQTRGGRDGLLQLVSKKLPPDRVRIKGE